LVIVAALTGAASWQHWSGAAPQMPSQGPFEGGLHGTVADVAELLAATSIAVAWHRRIILGEQPALSGSNIATKDLWRYTGVTLAIFLMVWLPLIVIILAIALSSETAFGPPSSSPAYAKILLFGAVAAAFAVAIAVMFRLSLLLPARAVGNSALTFREVWHRTSGNTWRIFWGQVACMLPSLLWAIVFMAQTGSPDPGTFASSAFVARNTAASIILGVGNLLILPIGIGFLSYAYRHFFREPIS
jgi:hypothetical protein